MNRWNEICFLIKKHSKENSKEAFFQNEVVNIFEKLGLEKYLHRYHWRVKSPSFCQGTSHQYQRKCASFVQKCPDKNPLLHLNSVHKERDIPDRYLQRHGYGHRQGWTLEHPH